MRDGGWGMGAYYIYVPRFMKCDGPITLCKGGMLIRDGRRVAW